MRNSKRYYICYIYNMHICVYIYIERYINKLNVFEQESYMITPTFQRLTGFCGIRIGRRNKGGEIN